MSVPMASVGTDRALPVQPDRLLMFDRSTTQSGSAAVLRWVAWSLMAVEVPVCRIDFGYFVRPAEETGTGQLRVEPCLGYVIAHPYGVVVVDTGMGSHPD